MKKHRYLPVFQAVAMVVALMFALSSSCTAAAMTGSIKITAVKTERAVGNVSRPKINMWSDITPALQVIVAGDRTVSVMSAGSGETVEVYEFTPDGQYSRTLSFAKELPLAGAFARDSDGNYYIFYGKAVEEGSFNEKNMALVKYSPQGERLNAFYLQAQTNDERWAAGYSGVKTPFSAGTCKMEISDGLIAVYFGRRMFMSHDGLNHQASYGFVLNIDTFEKLTDNQNRMPSAGHSFNQFILPVDGGFVTVDHGDNGPRAFMFSSVTARKSYSVSAFTFKKNDTYQNTFAEMGGIARTNSGYLFVGTYEKSGGTENTYNDSRNLFLLTMDESLGNISNPKWVTDYTNIDAENAIFPKIAKLDNDRFLLMWGVYDRSTGSRNMEVRFTIADQNGNLLQPIKALPYVRLNGFDPLRYNPVSGLAYWAVEDDDDGFILYAFDPDADVVSFESVETASDWARESVANAIYGQLVPSNLQGRYFENITRGEFCRLVIAYVEAKTGMDAADYIQRQGLRIDRATFHDTQDQDILAANALGIVNGVGNGIFNPDGTITRQEAATMLLRLQRALGYDTAGESANDFADGDRISPWAVDGVNYCCSAGVMMGDNAKRFDPAGIYTREQAIITVYRLFKL